MCKAGISCSHYGESGRVEEIRFNVDCNQIVGKFTGHSSRTSKLVTVKELVFLNKKAEKKALAIIAPLQKHHRLPEKKCVA